MTRPKRRSSSLVIFLVAPMLMSLCLLSGCNSQGILRTSERESSMKGTIRVSGAWALYPMMVTWGEEYQKLYPDVRIDISAGGAGKGMADALANLVDIGMISREIREEEISQGAFYVPVTKDTVVPVISQENPVFERLLEKGLTQQDFIDLWITGRSVTWGELTGVDSDKQVQVYTRSDSCGAAATWAAYLGGTQEDLQGIGVYGDPGLAEAVNKDPLGIGYNNLNYAFDMTTGNPVRGIHALPIDINENGQIDPEEELNTKDQVITAIVNGVYPSPPARDLYLVTKESFTSATRDFVMWILTDGQQYINEVGYIQLSQDQIQAAKEKIGE